jgi:hypothetical protein
MKMFDFTGFFGAVPAFCCSFSNVDQRQSTAASLTTQRQSHGVSGVHVRTAEVALVLGF